MNKKELLRTCLNLRRILPFVNLSFSQEGEDLVLERLLKYKKKGFYNYSLCLFI